MSAITATPTTPAAAGTATVQGDLWSASSVDWADIMEPLERPLFEHALAQPTLRGARRHLDTGCGSGLATRLARQRIEEVHGIDAAPGMIAVARARDPNIEYRIGDIQSLPYRDGSFDVVTGFNAFQYAASPQEALREARRVSRRGATIILATWGEVADCQAAVYLQALGRLLPPPPPGAPGPFALSDRARLEALARDAGLEPLSVHDVDCAFVFTDLEQALRGLLSAGPATRAIRTAGTEAVRAAVSAAIEPFRMTGGGYRLQNRFRYLVARA